MDWFGDYGDSGDNSSKGITGMSHGHHGSHHSGHHSGHVMKTEGNASTGRHMMTHVPSPSLNQSAHDLHQHHDSGHGSGQHGNHHGGSNSAGSHDMKMFFHGGYDEVVLFDLWRISSISGLVLSCLFLFVAAVLYEGLKVFRDRLQRASCDCDREGEKSASKHPGCGCKELKLLNRRSGADALAAQDLTSSVTTQDMSTTELGSPSGTCCSQRSSEGTGLARDTTAPEDEEVAILGSRPKTPGGKDLAVAPSTRNKCRIKNFNLGGDKHCRCHFTPGHLLQTFLHMTQLVWSYLLMLVFMTYNVWLCSAVVAGSGLGYLVFGWLRASSPVNNEHCNS
jgi:copper transporter 1